MKHFLILTVFLIGISLKAICFGIPSNSVKVIEADSFGIKLLHYHHISAKFRYQQSLEDLYGSNALFNDSLNTESWISATNKETGEVIFKVACSTYSDILVVANGKYFVGLSNMKQSRYGIVVFNLKGEVIFKKTIFPFEISIQDDELRQYAKLYPCEFLKLIDSNEVSKSKNKWYASLGSFPIINDSTSSFYLDSLNLSGHRLFQNQGITTGRFNNWFKRDGETQVRALEFDNELTEIQVLDINKEWKSFKLEDEQFSIEYFENRGWFESESIKEDCPKGSISEYLIKKYKNYWQIQIGELEHRVATKNQILSQERIVINAIDKGLEMEFVSCKLILVYVENGEKLFKEYCVNELGLIPLEFLKDLKTFSQVKSIGLEDVRVKLPDGIRRAVSCRYQII